jgi:peptide/nickel transport system permease protein
MPSPSPVELEPAPLGPVLPIGALRPIGRGAAAVLRRLVRIALTLLASSFLIFGALYITPGSPIGFLTGGRSLPPAQLEALEAQYHLDEPFFARYWHWLTGVLHGDFGTSIVYHTGVGSLISDRAGNTLILVLYAAVLIVFIGVTLGVLSAVLGRWFDGPITFATSVGMATPSFVVAVVMVTVFAVQLRWFPVLGGGSGALPDRLWHLTLPAIALAIAGLAYVSQTTRAAVRSELNREYAETARSRGIPERTVVRRHIVRNALTPIITVCGLSIAALVAGVAVVEHAFGLNGLGSYLIAAVSAKDFAIVQAISLILVTVFVLTNALVDGLCALADPRVRGRGGR